MQVADRICSGSMATDESRIASGAVCTPAGATMRNIYAGIGSQWHGANTSGLPVPKTTTTATLSTDTTSSSAKNNGQSASPTQHRAIPSTVGSAIRRRQTSSIAQQPSSNLNSEICRRNAPMANSNGPQSKGHTQIPRPPSVVGNLRQPHYSSGVSGAKYQATHATSTPTSAVHQTASFRAHLRLNPAVSSNNINTNKHSSFSANPKTSIDGRARGNVGRSSESNNAVQVLNPLKSTPYFSRISTSASYRSAENRQTSARAAASLGQGLKSNGYGSSSSSVVSLASSQDIRSEPVVSSHSTATMPTTTVQSIIGAPARELSHSFRGTRTMQPVQRQQQTCQSSQPISKPSQLVRPILQRSTTSSKFGLNMSNTIPSSRLQAPLISTGRQVNKYTVQQSAMQGASQSKLPATQPKRQSTNVAQPSRVARKTGVQTNPDLPSPDAQASLRYGLQSHKRSTTVLPLIDLKQVDAREANEDIKSVSEMSGCSYLTPEEQANENECECFVDANDQNESALETNDDEDDDDDEDATTASTMTNTSDSNDPMRKANQELDNMIRMLTSASEGRSSHLDVSKVSNADNDVVEESKQMPTGSWARRADLEPDCKRQSSVLRSQSLSFGLHQQRQQQLAAGTQPTSFADERANGRFRSRAPADTGALGLPSPRRSSSIKCGARPRSRIIFDPTSSQFHVSCTTEPSTDSGTSALYGDRANDSSAQHSTNRGRPDDDLSSSTCTSDEDECSNDAIDATLKSGPVELPNGNSSAVFGSEVIDESSRKLLEAQNAIRLLKPLPVASEVDSADDSSGTYQVGRDKLPPKCPKRQAQRCRSPVGSTLKSLFGLSGTRRESGSRDGMGSGSMVAKRNSLRIKMKSSETRENSAQETKAVTVEAAKKSLSIDCAGTPLTLIDYCNYGTSRKADGQSPESAQTRPKPRANDLSSSALGLDSTSRLPGPSFRAQLRLAKPKAAQFSTIPRLKSSCGLNKSGVDNDDENDADEDEDNYVEILAPLKSEYYISALSASEQHNDPSSGAIGLRTISSSSVQLCSVDQTGTGKAAQRNFSSCSGRLAPRAVDALQLSRTKPSQLVRPIPQATNPLTPRFGFKPSATSRLRAPKQTINGCALRSTDEPSASNQSFLHESKHNQKYMGPTEAVTAPQDRVAPESDSRRFSLQYNQLPKASSSVGRGNKSQLFTDTISIESSNNEHRESSDDDNCGSDFEDTMQRANRELDSVIQMLTSRSTSSYDRYSPQRHTGLAISDTCNDDADRVCDTECDLTCASSGRDSPTKRPRKLSVKKRQSSVLRSQSLSFGLHQQRQQQLAAGTQPTSIADERANGRFRSRAPADTGALGLPSPRRSSSIKCGARPRSRIIFDPTSSQFHVSCTTEPPTDSGTSASDGDDNDDEEGSNALPDVTDGLAASRKDSLTISSDNEDISGDSSGLDGEGDVAADELGRENSGANIDASSLKLLEAQSKIITLKHLPVSETSERSAKEHLAPGEPQASAQSPNTSALPPKCPPTTTTTTTTSATPKLRCRSPVGSALRSLFGLRGAALTQTTQTQAQASGDSPRATGLPVGTTRLATVVRHSSLRLDPRPGRDCTAGAAPPSMPKSRSVDGASGPAASLARHYQQQQPEPPQQKHTAGHTILGTDLLHRAGKRLSASSSSLTSRLKFIASSTPPPPPPGVAAPAFGSANQPRLSTIESGFKVSSLPVACASAGARKTGR